MVSQKVMNRTLISLGANLGDPRTAVQQAAERLQALFGVPDSAFRVSGLYRTPPVGGPSGQPPFINAVIAVESPLDPWRAWSIVRQVETELGRVRQRRWEARKIDVDILIHGSHKIWTPQLKIPHPRMCMRRFILAPACEVAAEWIDPVSQLSIQELASRLDGRPSSLAVVAPDESRYHGIVEQAARSATAAWRMPGCHPEAGRRWVQFVAYGQQHQARGVEEAMPGLAVYLTPGQSVEGAQWEDVHATLAQQLGFKPTTDEDLAAGIQPRWLTCPHYLLSSDDPDWAAHEIAASLDAMDCPVERVSESNA